MEDAIRAFGLLTLPSVIFGVMLGVSLLTLPLVLLGLAVVCQAFFSLMETP